MCYGEEGYREERLFPPPFGTVCGSSSLRCICSWPPTHSEQGQDTLPVYSRFSLFLKKLLSVTSKHRGGRQNVTFTQPLSVWLVPEVAHQASAGCRHTWRVCRALCTKCHLLISITPTSMNYDSCQTACARLRDLKSRTIDLPLCY